MVFEKHNNKIPIYLYFDTTESELILDKNLFVFYKDNEPYYFQLLKENYNKDELVGFIKNKFKLKDLKISTPKEKSFKKNYLNKLDLLKIKQSHIFKFYLLYLFFIFTFFIIFDLEHKPFRNNALKTINSDVNYIKNKNTFVYISEKLLTLNQKAEDSDIKINSYILKNSKISINFKTQNKQMIYSFLKGFGNSSIENINFDKKSKEYITNAVFKIY